jgi:hypothetical protein
MIEAEVVVAISDSPDLITRSFCHHCCNSVDVFDTMAKLIQTDLKLYHNAIIIINTATIIITIDTSILPTFAFTITIIITATTLMTCRPGPGLWVASKGGALQVYYAVSP